MLLPGMLPQFLHGLPGEEIVEEPDALAEQLQPVNQGNDGLGQLQGIVPAQVTVIQQFGRYTVDSQLFF